MKPDQHILTGEVLTRATSNKTAQDLTSQPMDSGESSVTELTWMSEC